MDLSVIRIANLFSENLKDLDVLRRKRGRHRKLQALRTSVQAHFGQRGSAAHVASLAMHARVRLPLHGGVGSIRVGGQRRFSGSPVSPIVKSPNSGTHRTVGISAFSEQQLELLESAYAECQYTEGEARSELARELDVAEERVSESVISRVAVARQVVFSCGRERTDTIKGVARDAPPLPAEGCFRLKNKSQLRSMDLFFIIFFSKKPEIVRSASAAGCFRSTYVINEELKI